MWVVDLGTCAIHMDDKPLHFPPPALPKRDQQQDNDDDDDRKNTPSTTNDISAANDRPKKRTRRVVDSSTTCAPEQLHCRYANKKCLNPRAVKRTGGLHTFCAMHRANANRNQRRLDMRKRMARQALREQAATGQAAPLTVDAAASTQDGHEALKAEAVVTTTSTTGGHAQYEPLQTPTPLQAEDISTLVTLFLPPLTTHHERVDGTFGYQHDEPTTPMTPHDWSSSTSTDGATTPPTPPPPPSGGMRF
ncbi:putative glucosidase [Phytophthora cinnamomi]|uniref:putative glucosidase n=1 Tax=Phytophthora cinnamomi TaxID=4785 RepID=UPI003559B659|nr:putative glucosidase [Phytophthora cinnamomi]